MIDAYVICKEMEGWDYWTYKAQPVPFLEVIRDMIRQKSK